MAAPRFTATERQKVKAVVAQMDRDGYSQQLIAAELERRGMPVSQQMVSEYLKQIRKEYQRRQQASHEEKVEMKREQLRDVIRRAVEAYQWSVGETIDSLAEQVIKRVSTMQRMNIQLPEGFTLDLRFQPSNEFLRTILEAIKLQCNLEGLTKDQQTNMVQQLVLDWSALASSTDDGRSEIDDKLAALESMPIPDKPKVEYGLKEIPSNGNGSQPHP